MIFFVGSLSRENRCARSINSDNNGICVISSIEKRSPFFFFFVEWRRDAARFRQRRRRYPPGRRGLEQPPQRSYSSSQRS